MSGRNEADRELDEALLRAVAPRFGSLTLVDTVSVFPREKPSSVVARLEDGYFPEAIESVELEVRAYSNGDFSITYREKWVDEAWMCRWDRHANPHNSRDHFHEPPRASTEDAVDYDYPSDFFQVIETVLEDVDERVGAVWESEDDQ